MFYMTKIPIEIVLQDPNNPIVPDTPGGDSGDNTNISVPNTAIGAGYTTKDSNGINNIFGGSNATVSIVSIVVLVLTLGAIATILVRKYQKHKKGIIAHTSKKEKLATITSSTLAVLATAVLVGNLIIPATNAATSVAPGTAELDVVDKITIIAAREQDSDTVTATAQNTSYATANLDFGYKVTASMAAGLTNANLYLDGDETSEYYISPVADGTLADNTWGYTLEESSEDYLSIPLADDPGIIKQGKDAVEEEPMDVYYYVKIASDMPAGTYSGELEYNLVALSPTIADLTYMQDFAPLSDTDRVAVLNSMIEDQPYYLQDSRDGKSYRIAKLKDGNVWMTQNLDLEVEDIKQGVTLNSDNTDHPATGFILPGSQKEGSTSWDSSTAHVYDVAYSGITYKYCLEYMGYCDEYGDDILATELGNLYNWYAATAGTGTSDIGSGEGNPDEAAGSICPAGWRLPNNIIEHLIFLRTIGVAKRHEGNE